MDTGGAFTDRLIAAAQVTPGARALDVGRCGGAVPFRLARAVGANGTILGIDPNRAALDAARRNARTVGSGNVSFEARDLFEIAASGATFDIVLCRRLLM